MTRAGEIVVEQGGSISGGTRANRQRKLPVRQARGNPTPKTRQLMLPIRRR